MSIGKKIRGLSRKNLKSSSSLTDDDIRNIVQKKYGASNMTMTPNNKFRESNELLMLVTIAEIRNVIGGNERQSLGELVEHVRFLVKIAEWLPSDHNAARKLLAGFAEWKPCDCQMCTKLREMGVIR